MAVNLREERGTTLIELMVGLAAGMVVLAALSMLLITTMRGSARVTSRVEATQRARVVLTQITEQLHSACLRPQVAPILPDSNGNRLSFVHPVSGTASQVAPTPQKSVISFASGNLKQADYAWKAGPPTWEWDESKASGGKELLTKVGPLSAGAPIFRYFKFDGGALKEVEPKLVGQTWQLGAEAATVIEVQVALNATPLRTPVTDPGSDSSVQNSAVLRLTPPAFPQATTALPCS